MKILLTLAATLAAFTTVSAAAANEPSSGHYEWKNRPVYGLNKSNIPTRVRVWVKDATDLASCDRAMMRDKPTKAMCIDMPTHGTGNSKG